MTQCPAWHDVDLLSPSSGCSCVVFRRSGVKISDPTLILLTEALLVFLSCTRKGTLRWATAAHVHTFRNLVLNIPQTNKRKSTGTKFHLYILICRLAVHSEWSCAALLNVLSKHVSLYVLCWQCLFRCTRIIWTAMSFEYAVFDNIYILMCGWPCIVIHCG